MNPSRFLAPSLVLAMAGLGFAADEAVTVGDFSVDPYANLGNKSGTLRIHPKAMLTGGYDSNVYAVESDPKSDKYVGGIVGAGLDYRINEALALNVDVQGRIVRYQDQTDRNLNGGSAAANLNWKGQVAVAGAEGHFSLVDDPLVQTGERIRHANSDAAVSGGWESDASKGLVKVGFNRVKYLEDVGGFDAAQRSYTGPKGEVRYARLGANDTEISISVRGSGWKYDSESQLKNGSQIAPSVGWQTLLGEKAALKLEGGVDLRSYSDESAAGANDQRVIRPIGSGAVIWPFAEKSEAMLRAYAANDNSLTSNAYSILGSQISIRWGATEQVVLFATGDVFKTDDTAAATGAEVQRRVTAIAGAGAEYHAVRGIAFRLTGRQTASNARDSGGENYHRSEIVLDTAFAF